jgi:hypothetical protein
MARSTLPPLPTWHGQSDRPTWRDRARTAGRRAGTAYGLTLLAVTTAGIVRAVRRNARTD